MLIDGLKLTVIGMGTVFLFLILMVFIISFTSKLLAPFVGILEKRDELSPPKNLQKSSKKILSAIMAAVHQYRQDFESKSDI